MKTHPGPLERRLSQALHEAASELDATPPPWVAPAQGRPRRAPRRAYVLGSLSVLSTALVVGLALAVHPAGRPRTPGAGRGTVLHYSDVDIFRPASSSGASFRTMTTRTDVWLYGTRAHVLERFSVDGRPQGVVEETVDGRAVAHFESGPLARRGEIDEGTWPSGGGPPCFQLTLCGPGLPYDPRRALRALLRDGRMRWSGVVLFHGRPARLAVATGSRWTRVFVDPRTGIPEQIFDTFGSHPWPADPLVVITLTGYSQIPASAANLAHLRMAAHPGARIVHTPPGTPPG